jgi:flavin-dependent dehydrogenase
VDRLKRFRRRDRATAGLAAAIQLKQLAAEAGTEVSVVVVEKGSEVGAHIPVSPSVSY